MKTERLIEIIREGNTPRSQWMRGVKEAALDPPYLFKISKF